MKNWLEIWNNRKPLKKLNTLDDHQALSHLLRLDGFDSPTGELNSKNWISFVDEIINRFKLNSSSSIYEVGCGSGAFLYPFYNKLIKVGGNDYSKSLVDASKLIMPKGKFDLIEAVKIDTQIKYDYVVSFSVFFYFPDYKYAERCIISMYEKSKKGVIVFDVPDVDHKAECEIFRRGALSQSEYDKKYDGLNHLYYSKIFFEKIAKKLNVKKHFFEKQNIEDYVNNKYRFNVYFLK